ncbi:MAG TPA: nucleoside triphosphate pyrophosphohydrolase [Candidatus Babeliales bacterium]|nr:nucleoside triphosphate pyrophosphohydrolase [Candidatus Babeliales bacterium]
MKKNTVKFICNKLSRDKTVANMESTGITTNHTILTGTALIAALNKKLVEEAHEVIEAFSGDNRNEMISELVDVLDLIDALRKTHNITMDEIKEVQKATHLKRGGYENGIFMETIEMEEDNPWVTHFRKSPEKYPEI